MSSTKVPQEGPVQPGWHREALATVPISERLLVGGIDIACQVWESVGRARRAPLVLIHGGAAHQQWWNHIAPLLTDGRDVMSLDYSGHGDSGWRVEYTHTQWAREVLAASRLVRLAGQAPVLIGHSMGGYVAMAASNLAGAELAGVIALDSPFTPLTSDERAIRRGRAARGSRVFATRGEVVTQFRPLPHDRGIDLPPYLVAPIAAESVKPIDGGWVWKVDPLTHALEPMSFDEVAPVNCRAAVLYGQFGMSDAAETRRLRERLGAQTDMVELPETGHNVMLEQPLALVAVLRTLLATWRV